MGVNPFCLTKAAVTDESTPPDIPTKTLFLSSILINLNNLH
jgi:hypothetical protein